MRCSLGKARTAFAPPPSNLGSIGFHRTSQAFLATVCQAGAQQRLTGDLAAGSCALGNALALHVGHLSQHCQDKLAYPLGHHA